MHSLWLMHGLHWLHAWLLLLLLQFWGRAAIRLRSSHRPRPTWHACSKRNATSTTCHNGLVCVLGQSAHKDVSQDMLLLLLLLQGAGHCNLVAHSCAVLHASCCPPADGGRMPPGIAPGMGAPGMPPGPGPRWKPPAHNQKEPHPSRRP
jgi:hypothetical protein